jgi:hypothetical protein
MTGSPVSAHPLSIDQLKPRPRRTFLAGAALRPEAAGG